MSNQTNKKHPINRGAGKLRALLRSIWLGGRVQIRTLFHSILL
jgi:hypothetical protein